MNIQDIIIKPITTEKSTREAGIGKYSFIVREEATKIDVKNAIKKLYGLDIESVKIVKTPSKERMGAKRQMIIKRPEEKKAIITLKDKKKTLDINKFTKEK